jgi:chromate transporter
VDVYLRLLLVFSELSVLGFGGGKGIIPEMHHLSVSQYQWVTSEQFTQFYTIGKLVPGPTTIFAALIGLTAAGITGAIVATVGMFAPSSVLMVLAGVAWQRLAGSPGRDLVARGLAPAIIGLVWSSIFTIAAGISLTALHVAIGVAVAVLSLRTKLSAPVLIVASGAAGVIGALI